MSTEQTLDLARMKFPTDQLTIGRLRELFPKLLDRNPGRMVEFGDDIGVTLAQERSLALHAFQEAAGLPVRRSFFRPDEERDILIESYVRYGLAAGEQHAEQLIRTFETAARDQARELTGHGAPG